MRKHTKKNKPKPKINFSITLTKSNTRKHTKNKPKPKPKPIFSKLSKFPKVKKENTHPPTHTKQKPNKTK